jgi:hypothetical protein
MNLNPMVTNLSGELIRSNNFKHSKDNGIDEWSEVCVELRKLFLPPFNPDKTYP